MPRFYFDVREGSRFVPDDDGLDFPDRGAAEHEAAVAAAEIGRDRLPKGIAREVMVEVRNEHYQRVATVTVTMEVERVAPPPVAPLARAHERPRVRPFTEPATKGSA